LNVLVTGAAGFLAAHVIEAFKQAGHEVTSTDVRDDERFPDLVVGDLTDRESALSMTQGIDYVCHLGGVGDVYLALESPEIAASGNVVGTATLASAALENGVQSQPINETHPCNPDHPYGITKLAAERMAIAYDQLKGLPSVALRLGTAYGSGMRPNSVFSIFIDRARQGQVLTVQGSGSQSRQFTHATDIARAFLLASESDVRGDVFNIVSDESISIRDLAERVARETPTEIIQAPAREGDVASAIVDSSKAKQLLGWEAKVDFQAGLRELIADRPATQ
jgi:UDP-glucose 4-epimerase